MRFHNNLQNLKELPGVPSSSFMYCDNYGVFYTVVKTIKNRLMVSFLLKVSSLYDVQNSLGM